MKVDGDGDGDNGFRVLNRQQRPSVNKRGTEDGGVVRKDQNSVENGVGDDSENVKDRHAGIVHVPAPIQVPQQQQSQGTSVCWERFLHIRTLKVLLVENDDCTRHVVAALLRNCSYEVIETSNGVQAWKILEDLANHVDIVLTEVVMPFVSGVGLLCKIMAHKTRRTVPVIMMSSHDSMGLVFKCLSKGAVDFLVKPIRKNELKILWQHVWRRCHSSSGSGSESGSGTQTQKSVKSKNVEKSANNTSSNDGDDDGSFGLNVGDGSDDGSGTQSSWTKQAVEVESPRALPQWDQVAECPDSTCAQVIHSNGEVSGNKQVPVSKVKEQQEEQQQLENTAIGKNLQIGAPPKPELQLKYAAAEDQNKLGGTRPSNPLEQGCSGFNDYDTKGLLDINSANNFQCEVSKPAGLTHNATEPYMDTTECKISDSIVKASTDPKGTPASFEVSLKRVRGSKDVSKSNQDERNVIRRSDCSAFSRYNAGASNTSKATWGGNTQSGPPVVASFDVARKGAFHDLRSHSNNPNQRSNVGSNTVDMGSTTNNAFLDSSVSKNKSAVTSMVKHAAPPSTIPQKTPSEKAADELVATPTLAQPAKQDDSAPKKKLVTTPPHGGSSNAQGGGPFEGDNACNCSVNGSGSGSHHGSNHGSNGNNKGSSPAAVHAGGANMESDNGIAGKSGSAGGDVGGSGGGGSGSGSGSGSGDKLDPSRVLQREAALTKFRQKRKERCFRKKVRYQSRKRLAEQRPRFRGQFVRKDANESTSGGATDN